MITFNKEIEITLNMLPLRRDRTHQQVMLELQIQVWIMTPKIIVIMNISIPLIIILRFN